jgi:hypothetical protein
MDRGAHRHLPRQADESQPQGPGGRAARALAWPGDTAQRAARAWCTHGARMVHRARMVHAWCTHGVCMGRRHTRAGTCATVAVSYRPSGSPRAKPRYFGTRSLRRCIPRRCMAAGSPCLGLQQFVRPPIAPDANSLARGQTLGPKPRFGDCRLHCVWPT